MFNKIDLLEHDELLALQERVRAGIRTRSSCPRSRTGGSSRSCARSSRACARCARVAEVRIPAGDGRLLAEIHREGEVIDQRSEDSVLVLHVRATEALIGRLKRGGATVS